MFTLLKQVYYYVKPFVPERLTLYLRRKYLRYQLGRCRDVWPINEEAGIQPHEWQGWPDGKKYALVLTHDVDSRKGMERCIELAKLEERLGFRSSFNFVAEDYHISQEVLYYLREKGFEIGIHGINHDGNIFRSYRHFKKQTHKIIDYLKKWEAVGFRAPSMYHNLNWIGELNIDYDCSTFDTDPFEPQSDGVCTIFPFWVTAGSRATTSSAISLTPGSFGPQLKSETCNLQPATVSQRGFVELPYTLPQDHTLFVLMAEKDISIWKKKLDWIVELGGMALLNVHPDYMNFSEKKSEIREYSARYYEEFLEYVRRRHEGQYWHVLPKDMARFWAKHCVPNN